MEKNERNSSELLEELDMVLACILHDSRAPNNMIIGSTTLLLDTNSDPLTDEQREIVEIINRAALRLLEHWDHLAIYKRVRFSETLHFQEYPVTEIIHASLATLQRSHRIENINFSIPDGLPPIECDIDLLSWAIADMIGNPSSQPSENIIMPTIVVESESTVTFQIQTPYTSRSLNSNTPIDVAQLIIERHGSELEIIALDERLLYRFMLP